MIFQRVLIVLLFVYLPFRAHADQWPFSPVEISTPDQSASDPQVAVNANGNVVAVWIENGVVRTNSADITGTWSPTIDTLSGTGASNPNVVIDSSSTATAVWIENGVINVASKPLNGSWPALPYTIVSSAAMSLKTVIDSNDNIVLIWQDNGLIQSATYLAGGSWPTSPDTLSATGASLPDVAIGTSGMVVAVWQELENTQPTVYQASKLVAGAWGAPAIASQNGINSAYPQVAVGPLGGAHIIWFRYVETNGVFSQVAVQATFCPLNGSWSTPADISAEGVRNPADLTLCLTAGISNTALVIWSTSYDGSLFTYEYNLFYNASWLPEAVVLLAPNLLAYSCSCACDTNGVAYALWMGYDARTSFVNIYNSVCNMNPPGGFILPWTLSTGNNNGDPIGAVSLSASNVFTVAAWTQFNDLNNVIQSVISFFPALEPASSPLVTAVPNDFGIVSEIDNVVQWIASPSSGIAGYTVFRNGVWFARSSPDVLQCTDHNRTIGETVTYSIYCTDIYLRQSNPATISFTN